jgi:hypothetical protein
MSAAFVSIPRITSGEPADANGWMLSCGSARRYSAASGSLSARTRWPGAAPTAGPRHGLRAAAGAGDEQHGGCGGRKIAQIDRFDQNVTERSNARPVRGIMSQNRPKRLRQVATPSVVATVPEFART